MSKWKETHPYFPPTAVVPRLPSLYRKYPIIVDFAVLRDGGSWSFVRCGCGKEFEYLQDQVQCPQCTRHFNKMEAEDLT